MQDEELLRYSRHILLDEIGIEGQARICAAKVLIIGAGGLGCPAALYLAAAGVGTLTLVDNDVVDLTNLQRQILHTTARVGTPKVVSAQSALQAINPLVYIHTLQARADAALLNSLVAKADVVLDCSDNFATRQAVNAACVACSKPLLFGAAIKFDAQLAVFNQSPEAPCYACVFDPKLKVEEMACATMGIFAPLTGIIGAMQAAEALKLIAMPAHIETPQLLMFDARASEWTRIGIAKNPHCAVCGKVHPS